MYVFNIFKAVCSLKYAVFSKSSDPPSPLQPEHFRTSQADLFLKFLNRPTLRKAACYIFVLVNWYGPPNYEQNFSRTRLVKRR